MTEYVDNLTSGSTITITTANTIVSGDITANDGQTIRVEARTEDVEYVLTHTGGKRTADDDDADGWPEYTLTLPDGTEQNVNDVRFGFYSSGTNPNLLQDDLGHPSRDDR